jgi:hypothetical protein
VKWLTNPHTGALCSAVNLAVEIISLLAASRAPVVLIVGIAYLLI